VQRYARGIPIRYLQLDSCGTTRRIPIRTQDGKPKNDGCRSRNGIATAGSSSTSAPSCSPTSGAFQQRVGLPLIAHNRWIDPASPYHQRYAIFGLAHSTGWWGEIIVTCHPKGRDVERRIGSTSSTSAPLSSLRASRLAALFHGMARAAGEGPVDAVSMGCRDSFFRGPYGNLTTIRVSATTSDAKNGIRFLYTSPGERARNSVVDVFMSRPTDNLLSHLVRGNVGIGDPSGPEDKKNLLHAVRTNGVIVSPTHRSCRLDTMYTAGSRRR